MNKNIALVGNPNCGKTTLFNALTGARQQVGNWPGVTVDKKSGIYSHETQSVEVVDLPGIYSLNATSVDEQVARDYLLSHEADLIVNIVDAANLERNLYLTTQLLEMKVPMIVALNMMDAAKDRQIVIDVKMLEKKLGCPVIPLVASKGEGVDHLKSVVNKGVAHPKVSPVQPPWPVEIQTALDGLVRLLTSENLAPANVDNQWLAIKLMERDSVALEKVALESREKIDNQLSATEAELGEETDILIADVRFGFIKAITNDAVTRIGKLGKTVSDRIDGVVLHRLYGIPVFLLAIYLVFMFTINLGGAFIDFFDILAGAIFVDGVGWLLSLVSAPEWLSVIIASGIGSGLQTVATFIPPVGFMFIALSILEDSGYMARAAFVMDRLMRSVGLSGKSFIPMLVGFGCNVPAIMATRTLENERDRLLTIMMNPFMSCGARLPVYALFAAVFFPSGGQNLVFLLYLIGIFFAVLTGLILKNTLLKGEITPFVMELPPYHIPTLRGILLRTWDRLQSFITRAGRILVPVVMVLAILNSTGRDGSFGNEDSENSILASIGKTITPIFRPMGISDDNWPATVGIFTGIFAKEAVVGTLDSLYGQMDAAASTEKEADEEYSLWKSVQEALASIPEGLMGIVGTFADPLGLSVGDISNPDSAAKELEVNTVTFGSMATLFGGQAAAFSYLLFILLYFPCSAAIAAVYRETNLKWTMFAGGWTTGVAYMTATFFYQAVNIGTTPVRSLLWIACEAGVCVLIFLTLRYVGAQGNNSATGLLHAEG
ncbi:MAG: ferrous iron transport protein [Desulfobulbaceae bacterium]|nr:MAG: ferrous iron transport protein [Desulfobulbaceae bacterium]